MGLPAFKHPLSFLQYAISFILIALNLWIWNHTQGTIYGLKIQLQEESSKIQNIQKCLENEVIVDGKNPVECVTDVNEELVHSPYKNKRPSWRHYQTTTKKFNVLFLYHHFHVDTIMDRAFFQTLRAAKKHPNIGYATMWGSGWPGWNSSLSKTSMGELVGLNIQEHFPNISWDVLITEPDRGHHMPELWQKIAPINSIFHHELYCLEGYGKCKPPWLLPFANVAFLAYANSVASIMHHITEGYHYNDHLLYHLPHGADRDMLFHPVEAPRNVSILLIGKINALYPLRQKLEKLINAGKIPGAVVREHPGYHNMGKEDNEKWKMANAAERQEMDYAYHLKEAQIVIVSKSVRDYAVRKYVEAAVAGCLLMGNIPSERQDEFRQYVVEINKDDSESSIISKINWWLTHDKERINRARIGQNIALKKYSYDHFVDHLVNGWTAYLKGERGVIFPYQHSVTGVIA